MEFKNLVRNNVVLLVCLLVTVFMLPVIVTKRFLLRDIIMTAILYSGIFSLDFSGKTLKILLPLGTLTATTTWIHHFFATDLIALMDFVSTMLFLLCIVVLLIRHIARNPNVTATTILSAINGYLLLGLLSAYMLRICDIIYTFQHPPGGHAIQFAGQGEPQAHDFLYFSFVTLTTLGYGDVTPISHLARSMSLFIAILGQLYLTILIAMLVGKFLARSQGN